MINAIATLGESKQYIMFAAESRYEPSAVPVAIATKTLNDTLKAHDHIRCYDMTIRIANPTN